MEFKFREKEKIFAFAKEHGFHLEHDHHGTHISMGGVVFFLRKEDVERGFLELKDGYTKFVYNFSGFQIPGLVGKIKRQQFYDPRDKFIPNFVIVTLEDKLDFLLEQ
jgi:hypothetical protein